MTDQTGTTWTRGDNGIPILDDVPPQFFDDPCPPLRWMRPIEILLMGLIGFALVIVILNALSKPNQPNPSPGSQPVLVGPPDEESKIRS